MSFTLGLAQSAHSKDPTWQAAVALARRWCTQAQAAGVDMLVFPESFMTRYETARSNFLESAQPLGGPYTTAMDALAKEFGLWLVYTVNEKNPDKQAKNNNPFNTVVLTGADGVQHGIYRKVHLFDAFAFRESDRMAPGQQLFVPVETPFGKVGLSICYDLRFPEVARAAALAGCDVFINPAAWVAGPGKAQQWEVLLRARAIENEMFVAGVSRVDKGYCGHSCIVAPDGEVLAQAEQEECLVHAVIDQQKILEVRKTVPVFEHRRPALY